MNNRSEDSKDSFPLKRFKAVRNAASRQNKRAKVLVFAAAIESDLSELIAKKFTGSDGIANSSLLDTTKAGSLVFASKIELANRIGLISHKLKTHLNMIRDFRNDCAHLEDDFDFSSANNRSRIRGAYLELSKEARDAYKTEPDDYEVMFESICSLIIILLQLHIQYIEKVKEANIEVIYIDGAIQPT